MIALPKPLFRAAGVFSICVESYRDEPLKKRLRSVETIIDEDATEYDTRGLALEFHKIAKRDNLGEVSTEDMKKLYDQKLVQATKPRALIYNVLKTAVLVCPLCGQRPVSTLDHYLPKSLYPSLAVLPTNLIPACIDCNKDKGTDTPATATDQTFHPYYDNWGSERWLKAEIQPDTSLVFKVSPPDGWPQIRKIRALSHVKAFGLAHLYSVNAAAEMTDIRHLLIQVYGSAGGGAAVQMYLQGQAESRERANPNSWKTAMYEACASTDWFYSGGFEKIPG